MTDSSPKAVCWACEQVVETLPFCSSCGKIVEVDLHTNPFHFFGFTEEFNISLDDLEQRYLEIQKQIHPDRFALKTVIEKTHASGQSSFANQAYELLKDPLRRAQYILEKVGAWTPYDSFHDTDLLMEMMERREHLAEANDLVTIMKLMISAEIAMKDVFKRLYSAFLQKSYENAQELIHRLSYLQKFLEEADAKQRNFQGH